MATGEAALLAGNKQESSGCVLAFFRIFRGKCSHLGLCRREQCILSNKISAACGRSTGCFLFLERMGQNEKSCGYHG